MKTRVYIHREVIENNVSFRHFIVTLPRDVQNVVGLIVTTNIIPFPKGYPIAGDLSITRDGLVIYDTQVRYDADEKLYPSIQPPGFSQRVTPIAGRKREAHKVYFKGFPRALFCTVSKAKTIPGYTLAIYFIYERKEKL